MATERSRHGTFLLLLANKYGCHCNDFPENSECLSGGVHWRTQEFFWEVQEIQLITEGRENGDLGAVAP
jgi:hypothetical protein